MKAKLTIWIPGTKSPCEIEGTNEAMNDLRNLIIRYGTKARSIGIPAMSLAYGSSKKESK